MALDLGPIPALPIHAVMPSRRNPPAKVRALVAFVAARFADPPWDRGLPAALCADDRCRDVGRTERAGPRRGRCREAVVSRRAASLAVDPALRAGPVPDAACPALLPGRLPRPRRPAPRRGARPDRSWTWTFATGEQAWSPGF